MSLASLGRALLARDGASAVREPRLSGAFDGEHVLVPLLPPGPPAVSDQVGVAATLARASDAALSLVNPIGNVESADEVESEAALLEWARDRAEEFPDAGGGDFVYTRDVVGGLLGTVRRADVDTLVLPSTGGGRLRSGITRQIAANVDCDVVVVNGERGYDEVASMLLPVAGGPHSGLAADIARSIAADCDAWIDVLHVLPADASERRRETARSVLDRTRRRIARPETTTTWLLEADDVAGAIVDQSRYYELTVLGAPTKGRLRRLLRGSTNRSVRTDAQSVVLSARDNSETN
jgi:nucleotide-binding universal stress UspA family protein